MPSLHRRLMLLVGVSSAVTLAISGIVVSLLVESQLWTQFDDGLRDRLYNLTQLVEQDAEKVDFEWNEPESPFTPLLDSDARVTCWSEGQVIELFPDGTQPLLPYEPERSSQVQRIMMDGQPARAVAVRFVPRTEDSDVPAASRVVTIAIARPTQSVINTIRIIRWSLVIAAILGFLLACTGAWISVARGLRPIRIAAAQIARIRPDRLDEQIDEDSIQLAELEPLLSTINTLLNQLRVAMERERALSSEIAHELRTPLAGLRAKLDVALAKPRQVNELVQTMTECSAIVSQTSSMIESLMATVVSRINPGDGDEKTDLTTIVQEVVLQFDERMTTRGLTIDHQIDDNAIACVGELPVRTVLNNLFDNAVSYADANTTIDLTCCNVDQFARIQIRNSASAFSDAPVERVFDRFWRSDGSRSDSENHHGLGLALTKRIVEASGGFVEASYESPFFDVVVQWRRPVESAGGNR